MTPRPCQGEGFLFSFSGGMAGKKGAAMVTHVEHNVVTDTQITPAQGLNTFTFDTLPLQLGGQLSPVTVAYETWGSLNAAGDNAVVIAHALTGRSHAHDAGRPHVTEVAQVTPLTRA